ncbi:MAG: hypothetical protein ACI8UP_002961 [Porticoccaceae bacterium]|jgi:hypothetical protein
MSNPEFNNARGSASSLQFTPPFSFSDMTVSVFPLCAELTQLQRFIDGYLNLDSENVRFEAVLPYVYLQILDYGKMSIEAANMGWVSQTEIAFCVPLRWMVKKKGEWVFHDWAVNCPFIFVDNELSMTTGREVYGWPKVLAQIDPSINQWVGDPHGCQRVFDIKLPDMHASAPAPGQISANGAFLSVHQNPSPNFLDIPLNLSGLLDPLINLPAMGLNMAKTTMDVYRTFGGIAMEGLAGINSSSNPLSIESLSELSGLGVESNLWNPNTWSTTAQQMMASLYPKMYMNTVNLKQFRDASRPSTACYQAITNSKMLFRNMTGGGPLGQQNLAFGQIDGGYRIDINELSQQPVVEDLGLLVDETRTTENGKEVSLKPVLPFWLKVDMDYSRGQAITWRSQSSNWLHSNHLKKILSGDTADESSSDTDDNAKPAQSMDNPEPMQRAAEPKKPRVKTERPSFQSGGNRYNTARGVAMQEIEGPFFLPQTTVRVLPLLADEEKLKKFSQNYLNVEGQSRFEAWGTHVYLIAYNYTNRISEQSSQPLFASREVNFVVPVKQYDWYEDDEYDLLTPEGRAKRDEEKLVSAALVAPFSYVDDASVAITSSEVHGVPTLRSEVGSPPHTWMNSGGPEAGQHLLITSALVLPELGVGAGASHEVLLNVSTDPVLPDTDKKGWRQIARKWGAERVADLQRKYAERGVRSEESSESDAFRHVRALALEVLTGKLSINSVTLKQFRDAWEPDEACYQALVQGRKTIDRLHEIHEIDEQLNVWITRYPTQPISEILGLRVKHSDPEKNIEVFEAIRPFWIRADLTEHLGQTLYERIADTQWLEQETPEQLAGWCAIDTVDLLPEVLSDRSAKLRYFQAGEDQWSEQLIPMKSLDDDKERERIGRDRIEKLLARQAKGEISDLQIYSRKRTRPIIAEGYRLDHIDREHVNDLTSFYESMQSTDERYQRAGLADQADQLEVSTLGKYFGQVSPATVLDSILSRQWGRPEPHRSDSPCADFVVHVESLGPFADDVLFFRHERRGKYWPQSADDRKDAENKRKGLAWQLWDDVWALVEQADLDWEARADKSKPTDPDMFMNKARECLPECFGPELTKKPNKWTMLEWQSIALGLKSLYVWHLDYTKHTQIKSDLKKWWDVAADMYEQLRHNDTPDTAGRESYAPDVANVLRNRLYERL